MTAHSTIGASSMSRWSKCPGSVRLSAGIASRSSSYAQEGTDAHALAEVCLRNGYSARRYIGGGVTGQHADLAVTQEMADAVQVYLDAVREEASKPGAVLQIEQKFDLSVIHPGCFGTADAVVWQPSTATLVVFDYKHGAGIAVDPEGNPQLQYYGLGALIASKYPAKRVRLVIVQPRCEHPAGAVRSWEIDAIDLMDFRADLKQFALATEAPDAPIVPGDHCRFCPALRECPAVKERQQALARAEFAPGLPYDAEALALTLESLPVIEAKVKAIREFAYAEAEAGRVPPRHKLVAKRATRRWRDEGEVIDAFQEDHDHEELFEPRRLKSPAQLEKVTSKEAIAPFVVAESSGHTLVSEADKRPPVRVDAASEFA